MEMGRWGEKVNLLSYTFGKHLDMSSLTGVDLSSTEVRNADAAVISVALEKNVSLTYLDLNFNTFEYDGASSLSLALT